MIKQLDLLNPEPRYNEYIYFYLMPNDVSVRTIRYLFLKHCGSRGDLSPLDDHIKEKIMKDLENFGGYGQLEDYQYHKYIYKHIVNMYWYVIGREDNIVPVNHWTECISI